MFYCTERVHRHACSYVQHACLRSRMAVGRERRNLLPRVFRVWAYKNAKSAATYQRIPRVRFKARYQRTLLPLPHPPPKSHPSSQNLDFQIYHLATGWFFWLALSLSLPPNGLAHVTSYSNLYFAFSIHTKKSKLPFPIYCYSWRCASAEKKCIIRSEKMLNSCHFFLSFFYSSLLVQIL